MLMETLTIGGYEVGMGRKHVFLVPNIVLFNYRAQEAEVLKEELRNAKLAERFAKEKLLEVSRDNQLYPVVSGFVYF